MSAAWWTGGLLVAWSAFVIHFADGVPAEEKRLILFVVWIVMLGVTCTHAIVRAIREIRQ